MSWFKEPNLWTLQCLGQKFKKGNQLCVFVPNDLQWRSLKTMCLVSAGWFFSFVFILLFYVLKPLWPWNILWTESRNVLSLPLPLSFSVKRDIKKKAHCFLCQSLVSLEDLTISHGQDWGSFFRSKHKLPVSKEEWLKPCVSLIIFSQVMLLGAMIL